MFYLQLPNNNTREAKEEEVIQWTINCSAGILSATRRLQAEQPKTLMVAIPSDVPTPQALKQLFQVMEKRFTGDLKLELWQSYLNYDKCDESIAIFPYFKYVIF